MLGRVAYGTDLHFSTARRNTNHDAQRRGEPAVFRIYHFNHAAYHLLGSKEVGNHAIAERTDRTNILVRLSVHLACLFSDRQYFVGTPVEGN